MNSPNHVLIGMIVYEYVSAKYGVPLNKASFLKGNTCPDHSLSFLRPHRMHYCKDMVKRKLDRTCRFEWKDESRRLSKKLGVLCHYYSDFFCLAHSSNYSGTLAEHIQYEQNLLFYMGDHMDYFKSIDFVSEIEVPMSADEIYEHMHERVQHKYSLRHDCETELYFAILSCIELVLFVYYQGRYLAKPVVQP